MTIAILRQLTTAVSGGLHRNLSVRFPQTGESVVAAVLSPLIPYARLLYYPAAMRLAGSKAIAFLLLFCLRQYLRSISTGGLSATLTALYFRASNGGLCD